jgi:hypothetical protein
MNTEGFSYETWYTMPVYLRNYYMILIKEENKRRQDQLEAAKTTKR